MSSAESENVNTLAFNNTTEIKSKFTRTAVEGLGNRVSMTDSDEEAGLQLFCYVNCEASDESLLKECRGVVFNNQEVVMRAFPYTLEYSHTDTDNIKSNIFPILKDCKVFDSYEGSLIRMFYFNGKWYTCTHRKLNAFRSKWASKESFGTSFKKALDSEMKNNADLRESLPDGEECLLERFQSTLDPCNQYMFLVLNNDENRIVCESPEKPTLFHVGTFVDGELSMNENINIPRPKEHNFDNIDDMINYIKNIDIRRMQGVIIFTPNNNQYKILNQEYLELFKARGNEPSIKYRYLQVRMDRRLTDILYYLYPTMINKFEEYENTIYAIAQNIYKSYVERYIKKKWITVPVEEYNVMRKCHTYHEQDRKQNRISLKKVIEILNCQSPSILNKMIRKYQNEKDQPCESSQKEENLQRLSSKRTTPSLE